MPIMHAIAVAFVTVMLVGSGLVLIGCGMGAVLAALREERHRRRDPLGIRDTIELLNDRREQDQA